MVYSKGFGFENKQGEDRKNNQGDNLLNDFELNKRKGASIFFKSNPIGRNLKNVFKKCNPPAYQYY